MDDKKTSANPPRLSVSQPHRPLQQPAEQASNFVPLKLMLVPTGMTVELTKPDQLMGRHSSADVRLPLGDVSRRHCRFLFTDSGWQVIDLESLNGVFVNQQRVRQATLTNGDRIRIGSFQFEVFLPTAESRHARRAS
jgi:pSer/pThr/pTyr-binding forkhead associated (FHA) protein